MCRADQDSASSIVYPQVSQQRVSRPLRKLLDQAKDNIDVIDFRSSRHEVRGETRTMSGLCQNLSFHIEGPSRAVGLNNNYFR